MNHLLSNFILGFVYFVPGKKHSKLIYDGYDYTVSEKRGVRTKWRCCSYRLQCRARVTTYGDFIEVLRSHNHEPKMKMVIRSKGHNGQFMNIRKIN